MSNKRGRGKRKAPSAAELARREAQAQQDTGEASEPVEVDLWGATVTISPSIVNDLGYTFQLLKMEDESEPEAERFKAGLLAVKHMLGADLDRVIAAIRRENNGAAPLSVLQEIMSKCLGALDPESRAS
ncbi:hypothetical protein I6B53_03255 [Schaalia sp. 19OD2882]|uniref:hypothetical protein n=1 Tax=Schaalia sp. 19OD2882 TaxID=2794089 RepID=UPI001C1F0D9B|nr:hypothetical protein [Schaalia sp. 19OD2882]QWW20128.1 hypothetical protein I6B53_03255 [Schaalia sp. 19OD2882]